MIPSDEELLHSFVSGKRADLGALAGRYEQALLDLAVAILGSRETAIDAVQETWLRVVRYAGSFNGQSSFKTWLYRIAINQCRSFLAARDTAASEVPEVPADAGSGPADVAARQDEAERLKLAVERLSPPLRETILLCYTHGLTHPEAAEAMEIPVGTVKSRVNAALAQLRKELGG